MFSLVTNASLADEVRIRQTVPSWLRVFGERLTEIVIVVDLKPPTGRISALHGTIASPESLWEEIGELELLDRRVRHVVLPPALQLQETARAWFTRGTPLRCQSGTPILGFAFAIGSATEDMVLRVDCDMLFFEAGWLESAACLLKKGEVDIVEPPRLGHPSHVHDEPVSTRALMLRRRLFSERVLPLHPHRLDWPRRIQRRLMGRPTWLALEQMLQKEKLARRLRHLILGNGEGFSMHVARREDAEAPGIEVVVESIERGWAPDSQRLNWDYCPTLWSCDLASKLSCSR